MYMLHKVNAFNTIHITIKNIHVSGKHAGGRLTMDRSNCDNCITYSRQYYMRLESNNTLWGGGLRKMRRKFQKLI